MSNKFIPKLRLTIAGFFISVFSFLQAQVNTEFSSINEYAFNTKEALNLVIVNSNQKAFSVFIQGKISDVAGQTVVEFKSSEVVLNVGSTIVTPMNTSLSDINYFNQDIAEIENRTGTYPSGNYNICVWLTCVTQDCNGLGPNAAGMEQAKCTQVHVENPTPLILATPENESEIEETRPLFTWIPPSPVAGSSNLNYTMILVEIMEGQNKTDALSINRPLIETEGINNPALIFPSDMPELEKGKTYAWQVQAFVGKTPIAKSEQWKFKIKIKKEEKKPVNDIYVVLKTDDKGIHHVLDTLKVIYKESKVNDKLSFVIRNEKGKEILNDQSRTAVYGENKYKFDLSDSRFVNGQIYLLVLVNGSGQTFTLKFIVIK